MAIQFDNLKAANAAYHAAINDVFTIVAPTMSIDELTNVKAKFGAYYNNIFKLMDDAQTMLAPYFEGAE